MADGRGATLYDMLLYRVIDRMAEDAHVDGNLDGDHAMLDALSSSVTDEDPEYEEQVAALQRDTARLKRLRRKPDASFEVEALERDLRYRHVGLIVKALRKRGHLDAAPLAVDEGSEEWLAG